MLLPNNDKTWSFFVKSHKQVTLVYFPKTPYVAVVLADSGFVFIRF